MLKEDIPCESPIAYSIGTLDNRFDISRQAFLDALAEAETVWEDPSGIDLFVHSPEEATLPVNLIYDYRQEATEVLSGIGTVVEESESAYRALQVRYEGLKTEHENAKNVFESRLEIFNEKRLSYQREVERWNSGPRNSKSQFDQLERARLDLNKEAENLESLQAQLNRKVDEINTLVGRLNAMAQTLNLNVDAYNTIGASRGETFTGGVFYTDGEEQSIDIYEFSSRQKLVRVLAHEFGHALGLEHVDDREAVMYYLNESDAGVLVESDLTALRVLCQVE
jgi:predicted Zn-dependent protease